MRTGAYVNILLTVIKLTVFLACLVIGYQYLQDHRPNWEEIRLSKFAVILIPIVLIFGALNWFIETVKWQMLINSIEKVTFLSALKATLSGVAVSFITPFRLGDFAGRIAHLKQNRKTAAVNTVYGNFAQLISTGFFGMVGLSIWHQTIFDQDDLSMLTILLVVGWSVLLTLLVLYAYPEAMIKMFRIGNLIKSDDLSLGDNRTKRAVLMLSVLRYIVFTSQYYICYELFGSQSEWFEIMPLIFVMYLLITFVPSPVLGKLGVRESVSLFLIGPYESSTVILAASILIWLINLFVPSVFGAYFLMRTGNVKKDHTG